MNIREAFVHEPYQVRTFTGRNISFTRRDVFNWTVNKKFAGFIFAAGTVHFVLDFYSFSKSLGPLASFIYWNLAALMTAVFYVAFMFLIIAIARLFGSDQIQISYVIFVSFIPTTAFNKSILYLITREPFPDSFYFSTLALQLLVSVSIFQFLFLEYVLPVIQAGTLKNGMTPQTNQSAQIVLSNQIFDLDNLIYIKSSGHYLEIHLNGGKKVTLYGKLAEVDQQSNAAWGLSPHRSYWVARGAIISTVKLDDKRFIMLHDGIKIPVARGRWLEAKAWLKQHLEIKTDVA